LLLPGSLDEQATCFRISCRWTGLSGAALFSVHSMLKALCGLSLKPVAERRSIRIKKAKSKESSRRSTPFFMGIPQKMAPNRPVYFASH
jgi:hypothetical protein